MKRFFKKALKPQKPFEVWAEEHNVELPKTKPKINRKPLRWVSIFASCILLVAIILPIALIYGGTEPPTTQIKIYSAQDVDSQIITLEELYAVDNILLFDKNQIIQQDRVSKDLPIDNNTLILGYSIFNCLISSKDEKNAFFVNYTIKLYENYEFYGCSKYSDLVQRLVVNDTEVLYEISGEGINEPKALLKFTRNSQAYYLEVRGFEGVTEITENSLCILLNDLF